MSQKAQLTPEQSAQAGIACILAYIDGSITRVCVQCGEIFHRLAEDDHLLCTDCRPCCDAPDYHTGRTRDAGDGTEFSDRVCLNCGARKQVQS